MKIRNIAYICLGAMGSLCTGAIHAQTPLKEDPAYLDFDAHIDRAVLTPTVEVNLPKMLLTTGIPEVDELLAEVRLVRVKVFELEEGQEEAAESAADAIMAGLDANWFTVVKVSAEDARIRIALCLDDSGETTMGLGGVILADGDALVLVNVVGSIDFQEIMQAAQDIGIGPGFDFDQFMGQIMGDGGGSGPANEWGDYDVSELSGVVFFRRSISADEKFKLNEQPDGSYTIQTARGTYLTKVDLERHASGGLVETDEPGELANFTVTKHEDGRISVITPGGYYFSARDGGGRPVESISCWSTTDKEPGDYERFRVKELDDGWIALQAQWGQFLSVIP